MITRFRIKSNPERSEFLEIIGRTPQGLQVRIVRHHEGYDTVDESFMDHDLFETCLKTGYLTEIDAPREAPGEDQPRESGSVSSVA
ncbi:hypothetical protein SAMN05920897_106111 [Alkalispirochaeta americana]|uniref:Uncharacterized protein n=1 Tax=Alkalispirochaeta americana TaxID=159291 RepID=A0A1N6RHC4_9SPIO|nr:hypothetical protein [Alkalispirochaeta americana]SIQ28179.1 hypothetical protein SAMN05920897_106111 [Alkalispirochaeta americana]